MAQRRGDVALWFSWVIRTVAGGLLGLLCIFLAFLFFAFLLAIAAGARPSFDISSASEAVGIAMMEAVTFALVVVSGALFGVLIGLFQGRILESLFPSASLKQWLLASISGWVIGCATAGAMIAGAMMAQEELVFAVVSTVIVGPVIGAMVGGAQWFVVRKLMARAGWWVIAATVGLALGWVVGVALLGGLPELLIVQRSSIRFVAAISILLPNLCASGPIYGAVTGGALIWLLRSVNTRN